MPRSTHHRLAVLAALLLGTHLLACGTSPTSPSTVAVPAPSVAAPIVRADTPAPPASADPTTSFPPPDTDEPGRLRVYVHADGRVGVRGAVLEMDAIAARVREISAAEPELRAVIVADGSVTHGRVIGIMDRLLQAGVTRIAFAVSPTSGRVDEPAP